MAKKSERGADISKEPTCICVKCNYDFMEECMEAILAKRIDKSLYDKLKIHCIWEQIDTLHNQYDTGENENHLELEAKERVQKFLQNQINRK